MAGPAPTIVSDKQDEGPITFHVVPCTLDAIRLPRGRGVEKDGQEFCKGFLRKKYVAIQKGPDGKLEGTLPGGFKPKEVVELNFDETMALQKTIQHCMRCQRKDVDHKAMRWSTKNVTGEERFRCKNCSYCESFIKVDIPENSICEDCGCDASLHQLSRDDPLPRPPRPQKSAQEDTRVGRSGGEGTMSSSSRERARSASVDGRNNTAYKPGQKYRVCGTIVRQGESLESEKVVRLGPGTVVEVLEIGAVGGKRVRVRAEDSEEGTVEGWISVVSADGAILMKPVNSTSAAGRKRSASAAARKRTTDGGEAPSAPRAPPTVTLGPWGQPPAQQQPPWGPPAQPQQPWGQQAQPTPPPQEPADAARSSGGPKEHESIGKTLLSWAGDFGDEAKEPEDESNSIANILLRGGDFELFAAEAAANLPPEPKVESPPAAKPHEESEDEAVESLADILARLSAEDGANADEAGAQDSSSSSCREVEGTADDIDADSRRQEDQQRKQAQEELERQRREEEDRTQHMERMRKRLEERKARRKTEEGQEGPASPQRARGEEEQKSQEDAVARARREAEEEEARRLKQQQEQLRQQQEQEQQQQQEQPQPQPQTEERKKTEEDDEERLRRRRARSQERRRAVQEQKERQRQKEEQEEAAAAAAAAEAAAAAAEAPNKAEEDEALRRAEEELAALKRQEEEDAALRRAEEELAAVKRQEEEEEARRIAEEDEAIRRAEEDLAAVKRQEEEDARRQEEEDEALRRAEEELEAVKRQEEEEARRLEEEEEAALKRAEAEAAASRMADQEAAPKGSEEDAEDEAARRRRARDEMRRAKREAAAKRADDEAAAAKEEEENSRIEEEVHLADAPEESPLAEAARRKDLFRVQALLRDKADPNETNAVGETPLLEAAASGDINVVALLLGYGADPAKRGPPGVTDLDLGLKPEVRLLFSIFTENKGKKIETEAKRNLLWSLDPGAHAQVRVKLWLGEKFLARLENRMGPAECLAARGTVREFPDTENHRVAVHMADPVRPVLVLSPLFQPATATVVLLHGLFQSGMMWERLARDLSRSLPHVRFLAPTAPTLSCNFGVGPGWHSTEPHEVMDNLKEFSEEVVEMLQQQKPAAASKPDRVVLLGFSNGGTLAAFTALKAAQPFAGLMVFGTLGVYEGIMDNMAHPGAEGLEVLYGHGGCDGMVSLEDARAGAERLRRAGCRVHFSKHADIGHNISTSMVSEARSWLARRLPDGNSPQSATPKESKTPISRKPSSIDANASDVSAQVFAMDDDSEGENNGGDDAGSDDLDAIFGFETPPKVSKKHEPEVGPVSAAEVEKPIDDDDDLDAMYDFTSVNNSFLSPPAESTPPAEGFFTPQASMPTELLTPPATKHDTAGTKTEDATAPKQVRQDSAADGDADEADQNVVDTADAEVEVLLEHAESGETCSVIVAATATMWNVKEAVAMKFGLGHTSVVRLMQKKGPHGTVLEGYGNDTPLGRRRKLLLLGVALGPEAAARAKGKGLAPLASAARSGDVEELKNLLRQRVDPNDRDAAGETALFSAVRGGHAEAAAILLLAKADPSVRSENGLVAADLAEGRPVGPLLWLATGAEVPAREQREAFEALEECTRFLVERLFETQGVKLAVHDVLSDAEWAAVCA